MRTSKIEQRTTIDPIYNPFRKQEYIKTERGEICTMNQKYIMNIDKIEKEIKLSKEEQRKLNEEIVTTIIIKTKKNEKTGKGQIIIVNYEGKDVIETSKAIFKEEYV